MAHDDEAPHPGSIDPAVARGNTSGSTTPPVDSGGSTDIHDDDALADALAAEYSSLATAAIPVVTQPVPGSGSASGEDWLSRMFDESEPDVTPAENAGVTPSLVAAAGNDESFTESSGEPQLSAPTITAVDDTVPATGTMPTAETALATEPALADGSESIAEPPFTSDQPEDQDAQLEESPEAESGSPSDAPPILSFVSPSDPPASSASVPDAVAAPWSLFPAPDPSQAVDLPDGPPQFFTPSEFKDWPSPAFDEPAIDDQMSDSSSFDSGSSSEDTVRQDSFGQDSIGRESVPGPVSSIPVWGQPQGQSASESIDSPAGDSSPTAPSDDELDDARFEFTNDAPIDAAPADDDAIPTAPPFAEPPAPRREAPNAWAAWVPSDAVPSEWGAAAPTPAAAAFAPSAGPDAGDAVSVGDVSGTDQDASTDPGTSNDAAPGAPAEVVPELDDRSPQEPSPEPSAEPAPEPFPWIVAAAAAAAAQPLVPPLERGPFNWSITATGKVAYLDGELAAPDASTSLRFEEPVLSESVTTESASPESVSSPTSESASPESVTAWPEPESASSAAPEAAETESVNKVDEVARMFAPPPLIEPLSTPPYLAPVSGLPSAPPAYFPVDRVPEVGEPAASGTPVDAGLSDVEPPSRLSDDDTVVVTATASMPVEPTATASLPVELTAFDSLFIVPLPTVSGGPVPTTSGSITVVDQAYEEELDDDVDDTDRAFGAILSGGSAAAVRVSAVVPSPAPNSTVRIAEHEQVIFDDEPKNPGVLSLEHSGLEPTPVDVRAGRAIRLFWLWFSANSSVISVALGAVVFATGMSLRQSVVSILGGVALSFFPLALTTLAGKLSGQPTMVVSRATFGLLGNVAPAVLAVISRAFWGAVLLWLLATSVAAVTSTGGVTTDLQPTSLATLAIALVLSLLVAFVGYPLLARIQLVLTVVSVVLILGLIGLTAQSIDIPRALTVGDGSWVLAMGGAVLVFSVVGLVWAFSGADLARYQRPSSSGASSMLFATFGTAIPAFVLIAYGAMLAASSPALAAGLATKPLQTLAGLLPDWYPIPLIAATTLSLLSGVVITMYSGGLALQSAGVRLPRQWSVVVVGIAMAGLATLMVVTATAGIGDLFRDFATTMAVPTAAWIGIFGSEMMIRNRRFDSESLLRRGGVYADVRWVNLAGLVLISVIGFGLTTATVSWLSWQGFVFSAVGVPLGGELASTDLGVIVALALGIILPLVAGVPAIRRQESLRA